MWSLNEQWRRAQYAMRKIGKNFSAASKGKPVLMSN